MITHHADTDAIHHGDNLDKLRSIPGGFVDLIYIDPPFNSGRSYEAKCRKSGEKREFDDHFKSTQAYIDFMRPRCAELRRVLKDTGSFYLHCDDSASHHLNIMLDDVFGMENLLSRIAWKRSNGHVTTRGFGRIHDTILFYRKAPAHTWNPQCSADGEPLGDCWADIPPINSQSAERVDYPTQKPLPLLERIIRASSNPGDIVLDAFCGAGTTLAAARNLGRRWIGIDASEAACKVSAKRLGVGGGERKRTDRGSTTGHQLTLW